MRVGGHMEFFVRIRSRDFLIICMVKLGGHRGRKVAAPDLFTKFVVGGWRIVR